MTPSITPSCLSSYAFSDSDKAELGCILSTIHEPEEPTASDIVKQAEEDFNERKTLLSRLPSGFTVPEALIRNHLVESAKCVSGIKPLTKVFIDTFKGRGSALDVGCGIGYDSIALLRRGWSVYLVDKYPEVFETFKKLAQSVEPFPGKYQTINKDITTMSLRQGNLDLVLAHDVLPYLPPSSLLPTIKKIFLALRPGGMFMGSLLSNRELKTQEERQTMADYSFYNAISYTNPPALTKLFQSQGFHLEAYIVLPLTEASDPARVVTFVARKPI